MYPSTLGVALVRRSRTIAAGSRCALLVLVVACGDAADSSGAARSGSLERDPDFTIGLVEGDSAYMFGDIRAVAVDAAGRVYVGDRIGATIRAYDGSGRFIERIAREGRGPGEVYGWPADIETAPDGTLFVRDGSDITLFAISGSGGIADSVAAVWPWPGYGNLTSTRGRVGGSGEYYYPGGEHRPDELPRFFYLPFRDGVVLGDTLEVPSYPGLVSLRPALYRLGATDALMLEGLSHVPFAPIPVWDVTEVGTIVSSDGTMDELIETTAGGDTVRVIAGMTSTVRQIPAGERADSARALAARLDALRVPVDEIAGLGEGVREGRLPANLPPLIGLHVAADGMIWVERWPDEGQGSHRFYDVLQTDGRSWARITLRAPLSAEPPPHFGGRYIAGVVVDSVTGVERVVRFTIPVLAETRPDSVWT
jgi:hypothetical protein